MRRRSTARPAPLLAALLACAASCSGGESAADGLASSHWVVRNSPPYPLARVTSDPVVRIGALEGSSEVEFTRLVHVAVLENGGIVAVDGGPNEVRWFDEGGAFQLQAGGRGEGPGEFMFPVAATLLPGDTLVVFDGRTQRLTAFDEAGALAGTRRLEVTSGFGVTLGSFGDGGLLAVEQRATLAMGGSEYNRARDTLVLLVPSMAEPAVDTVARLPGPEAVTWVAYQGGEAVATRQMELPLGEVGLAAPVRGGVAVVRPGEEGLSFYSMGAELIGYTERSDLEPIPVAGTLRDRFVAQALEEAPDGSPPPGIIQEEVEARFALLGGDRTVPPYDRILTAADGGSVWLRQYVLPGDEDEPSQWTVFDLDGSVRAEATLPPAFRPTQVRGERIAGIETDRLGVEYAAVYAFEIRDGSGGPAPPE